MEENITGYKNANGFLETSAMKTLHVKKANTFWQAIRGLIGAKKPHALYMKTRFGIHTFGVLFPIDVVILDAQHRVVKLQKSLKPNRIFFMVSVLVNCLGITQQNN